MSKPNVDKIIEKLLSVKGCKPGKRVDLTEKEVYFLINKVKKIFAN